MAVLSFCFFFSSRRRHTRFDCDWSSDVCSSDLDAGLVQFWKLKDAILCSSHYALEKARINLTENMQRRRLTKLARRIYLFDAAPRELPSGLSLPEKDVPILLAALEAQATHLITGDV